MVERKEVVALISPIWANTFLNIIQKWEAGNSPFDEASELQYAFMRIDDTDLGNLYVWDSKNHKKGIVHRIPIPDGANEIEPQNDFLTDYELV